MVLLRISDKVFFSPCNPRYLSIPYIFKSRTELRKILDFKASADEKETKLSAVMAQCPGTQEGNLMVSKLD